MISLAVPSTSVQSSTSLTRRSDPQHAMALLTLRFATTQWTKPLLLLFNPTCSTTSLTLRSDPRQVKIPSTRIFSNLTQLASLLAFCSVLTQLRLLLFLPDPSKSIIALLLSFNPKRAPLTIPQALWYTPTYSEAWQTLPSDQLLLKTSSSPLADLIHSVSSLPLLLGPT